jgi:hypothetical protein
MPLGASPRLETVISVLASDATASKLQEHGNVIREQFQRLIPCTVPQSISAVRISCQAASLNIAGQPHRYYLSITEIIAVHLMMRQLVRSNRSSIAS